jgi:hypothetical protein
MKEKVNLDIGDEEKNDDGNEKEVLGKKEPKEIY